MSNSKRGSGSSQHEVLYKMKSPSWRTVYKERCRERMKQDRAKLVNRFRAIHSSFAHTSQMETCESYHSSVPNIMETELNKILTSSNIYPDISEDGSMDSCYGSDEELQHIMEDIERELKEEEQQVIMLYELDTQFDDLHLQDMVNRLSDFQFLCPVCQRSELHHSHPLVTCPCGLSVQLSGNTHLKAIHDELMNSLGIHNQVCDGDVRFYTTRRDEAINNTVAGQCEKCGCIIKVM